MRQLELELEQLGGELVGRRPAQIFTAPEREETRRFLARLLAGDRAG